MSEEDSSERKHQPSPKKLEKLRKEGSFLRAKEFYSGISLLSTLMCIFFFGSQFIQVWSNNFYLIFNKIGDSNTDHFRLDDVIYSLIVKNLVLLVPIFGISIVFFLFSVSLIGKLQMPEKMIRFKADRFHVIRNLKNIYSLNTLVELFKSLFKFFIFSTVLFLFFYTQQSNLIKLSKINQFNIFSLLYTVFTSYFIQIIFLLILIALIDAALSKLLYNKKAKMTTQELKDESKETDGNPELKKKIRQMQQQMSSQRMQKTIPTATVIITNPTHYAVALRYDNTKDSAPIILAKGMDHKALQIRQLAIKHGVPLHQAPELARALYKSGKEGGMIHPQLYMAVAIVLNYILQLKEYQIGRAKKPEMITDHQIPTELT